MKELLTKLIFHEEGIMCIQIIICHSRVIQSAITLLVRFQRWKKALLLDALGKINLSQTLKGK